LVTAIFRNSIGVVRIAKLMFIKCFLISFFFFGN